MTGVQEKIEGTFLIRPFILKDDPRKTEDLSLTGAATTDKYY